jgi:hypothetical protein
LRQDQDHRLMQTQVRVLYDDTSSTALRCVSLPQTNCGADHMERDSDIWR